MRLRRHSRSWIPSRSSGQQRSSESFLRPDSRSRSKHGGGAGRAAARREYLWNHGVLYPLCRLPPDKRIRLIVPACFTDVGARESLYQGPHPTHDGRFLLSRLE